LKSRYNTAEQSLFALLGALLAVLFFFLIVSFLKEWYCFKKGPKKVLRVPQIESQETEVNELLSAEDKKRLDEFADDYKLNKTDPEN
jgi:hypothetical protein